MIMAHRASSPVDITLWRLSSVRAKLCCVNMHTGIYARCMQWVWHAYMLHIHRGIWSPGQPSMYKDLPRTMQEDINMHDIYSTIVQVACMLVLKKALQMLFR